MARLALPARRAEGMTRGERLRGAAYGMALLWVNAYVCRDWLRHPTAHMNTLHGYWAAIARLGEGWFHPSWWPFWDLGIPFEFTSAPFVPALAAALAPLHHGSHLMAVESVSAIFYCLAPLAFYLVAWAITRAAGYSFFAGLAYSLLAPENLLAPDGAFSWARALEPHRLNLQALWDETPRYAALTFLLLFIGFLSRAIETRRPAHSALAALSLAVAMLASPFAALSAALAGLCLLQARLLREWRPVLIQAAGIGLLAYALTARFLPPSLWFAMGAASAEHEAWSFGSLKILAAAAVGWLTLAHYLERWNVEWRIRFFALWAYTMSCGPMAAVWLHRLILPQGYRFTAEMAPALVLAAVFAARPWLDRMPRTLKAALTMAALILAEQQLVHYRRLAKDALYPQNVTQTIEYRAAERMAHDLPGARVMAPGSIAHWADAFTGVFQFSGSEGTMAYRQTQQRAMTSVYQDDARVSLAWLKAYGAAAVLVSGPDSRESWKPFAHPGKFEGLLPPMWSDEGVTAYRVPQRSTSFAHVLPRSAIAKTSDMAEIDRYGAALDDPGMPEAVLAWNGRNRFSVHALTAPGQALSMQISYHPGWHAAIDGQRATVHRDGLGMMWLDLPRGGPAVVEMRYDGGWELRLCGWISGAAIMAVAAILVGGGVRR